MLFAALPGLALAAVLPGLAPEAKFIEAPIFIERPSQIARRDVFGSVVANQVFFYAAEVDIGTPPQPVRVVLDTGSSDMWVMKSTNPYCQTANHTCHYKTFDTEQSSSFNSTGETFTIKYGDQSYAHGEWAEDQVHFAGVELNNVKFAVANETNSTQVVLGIGLPVLESTVEKTADGVEQGIYDNVPQLFKTQGHIDHVMYSLWLNGHDSMYGSVLFGGIDRSKYDGELARVPIINLSKKLPKPYSFHVMINGISHRAGNTTSELVSMQYPALLDSGTSFAYLPPQVVQAMAQSIGYKFSPAVDYYVGPCSVPLNQSFVVSFSGKEIDVPLNGLVMPYSSDAPDVCALTVLPSHSEYSTILGDVFLRNMYAVFDLENYEIGLAQARTNVTESDIMAFDKQIPGDRAPLYHVSEPSEEITVNDVKAMSLARANAGSQVKPLLKIMGLLLAMMLG